MKIVCDACQAKYSISDDKVQGKVFKIRCKKCSNIIVVRGGGGGAAEAAPAPAAEKETRVYDYGYEGGDQPPAGDESVWHVVINQDQVGPMTAAEVQQKFAAGEIDGETYIWREGFTDWLPMSQVDTFAAYVASGSTTAAVSGTGGANAVAAMFGGGNDETGTVRSDPGDLFAAASGARATASAPDDDGGDLFGSKPGTGGGAASASASGGGGNSKLRGERNENSVLFSLGNLAQLASDKPAAAASSSSSASSSGAATGAAGGEGSGLIDIRSMANAYRGPGGAAKPATASAGVGSIDDLPVFSGAGFSEPAVIMPTARPAANNKMMFALIGAVGVLAVAAVILIVVLMKGDNKDDTSKTVASADVDKGSDADKAADTAAKEPDPATKDTGTTADKGTDTATKSATDTTTTKEPETAKEPETTATKEPASTATKEPTSTKSTSKSSSSKSGGSTTKTTSAATPPEKPAVKEPPSGGACDEVSCVLSNYDGACCAKFKKGGGSKSAAASSGGGGGDLPDLNKDIINEGVSKVKARVLQCGSKSSAKGTVKVSVKVAASGSVSSVTVKETPDPALGSCVAGAMQKASFKKTQNGGSFSYPFNF